MTNLNEIILRIKADTSNFDNPKDIIRDELPQFWRGNNLKFEIGVFDGDNLLSVSSYASITVAIRKMLDNGEIPSASHQALMQKSTYDLNDALTIETWKNGSSQHASVQFSAEESNILSGNHWLSIWASTSDAAPKYITLCAGIIRVCEDGGGISSQPPEPLVVYYTARECDDTFVNKDNVDPSIILGTSDEKISTQKAVKTYVDSIASEKASTASNLGSGEGVFSSKSGANLQFKSLKAGNNVTISSDSSEITISSTGGGGGGMSNPMTTSGDLIVGGTSGIPTRLGVGSAGKFLKVGSSGNSIEWGDGSSYTLPPATSNILGGIKVGNNLSVTQDGTLSADAGQYELPVASSNTLGGIKIGERLSVTSSGVLSANDQSYTLPPATSNTLGGIKVGNNLSVTQDGTLSADDQSYTLPIASASTLGGVKPDGSTITINSGNGIISSTGEANTASNLGSGEGIFSSKSGANLQFKSLKAGSNVTISSDSSEITISSAGGGGGGMSNPMTTSGDLIVGGTSGTPTRLGVGSAGKFLKVGSSGNSIEWGDGSSYTLPPATSNTLGGIKVGSNLSVTQDGTLSADAGQYELPVASTNTLGGIKVGERLSVTSGGVLSANDQSYTLQPATSNTLGGIKVGNNLSVTQDGTLSADAGQYELPIAGDSTLGGIKVGERLSITSSGVLSASDQSYTLPPATSSTLGGIKVGSNLSVTQDGTLSADDQSYTLPIASASTLGGVRPDGSTITINSESGVISSTGEANTASNLGSGEGVFLSKSGANLQFKSLKAGNNVTISADSSEITISSTGGGGGGGMSNPMTTSGDLIVGGTSGTPMRLGVGSAEQALVVNTNCDGVTWKDVLSCTSKSLSSNGYFTFSDGLILQWGYLAFAGTNRKESTITLPVSFSSKNYSFSGLIKSNVSGTDKHSLCLSENARSSSTLTVCIYGADSSTTFNGITWIAVGY